MTTTGLGEEVLCRFCQEEEKTAVHVFCYGEGTVRLKFLQMGEEKVTAGNCVKEPLSRLRSLVKRID